MTVVPRSGVASLELAAALASLAEGAPGKTPALVAASLPVERLDPVALYALARPLGASLWLRPDEGLAMVAVGEAWAVRAAHAGRFETVSTAWRSLLDGARLDVDGAPPGAGPLLFGGFGFDPDPVRTETWRGFEPAHLSLPALLLTVTPAGAWLTGSMVIAPGAMPVDAVVALLQRTWGHLVAGSAHPTATAPGTLRVVGQRPEAAAWRDSVARLAGAVGRGRLDKAVLSREVTLQAGADIDVPGVLQRLRVSAPESTVFALSRGPRTFLGATPEHLVSLRGSAFTTMAMAGSTRRTGDEQTDAGLASELLESDKEREEHAVVVAMLRESLAPVAAALEVGTRPEVLALRHVQHLVTPVSGRLAGDLDVLALVQRLHPTPAVGGSPRELALELIAEEEGHERGWYSGPLGWIDHRGDGDFVVALRSGVVAGDRATIFAGCGIVADSDPEREWQESAAKLRALGSALGAVEP